MSSYGQKRKIETFEIRTYGLYVRCNGRFLGAKQTFDLIRGFNHQLSFGKVTTKQSFSGFYLTKAKTWICHSVRFVNSKFDLGLRLGDGFGVFLTTEEKNFDIEKWATRNFVLADKDEDRAGTGIAVL